MFDTDKLSKRILDQSWPNLGAQRAKHEPKMPPPQNDPKSIKNRLPKIKRGGDSYKNRRITDQLLLFNNKLHQALILSNSYPNGFVLLRNYFSIILKQYPL